MENYLECEFTLSDLEMYNIDVLKWWSSTVVRFLIMSRMIKDLLTIPAFTVASEYTFSASKRILSNRMCKLSKKSIEVFVYLKD